MENLTHLQLIKLYEDEMPRLEKNFKEARDRLKLARRKLIYLKKPIDFYPELFYSKRHVDMRIWEIKLGKALAECFKIQSMVDFGCGLGSYIEGALQGGCDKVLGIDLMYDTIMKYAPDNMKPFIKYGNAGEPVDCGKWDCVFSIETAEHLIEEEADTFVSNLINASSMLIVLSASLAGGRYHFNRQPKEYWIGKIVYKGPRYSHKKTNALRRLWAGLKCPSYILNNLMVFEI